MWTVVVYRRVAARVLGSCRDESSPVRSVEVDRWMDLGMTGLAKLYHCLEMARHPVC